MELEVDLDERYRPKTLDDVCGQPEAVAVVKSWGQNIPRAIMFHGSPGTGKTSISRVVAHDVLGIDKLDYQEVNCGAVKSAIDMVRDLTQAVTSMPAVGAKKMWTLDEAQVFSRSKGAAEALLKVLEDAKPHVVFSLCTTEPQRLLPAIRSRCVSVGLRALTVDELTGLIQRVAKAEKVKLDELLVMRIAEVANGSPRTALKELQKVIKIKDPSQQMAVVGGVGVAKAAKDLIAELMPFKGSPSWPGVAKVLSDIKDENAEGIRQMLLAVARTALLKGKPGQFNAEHAANVITELGMPYHDAGSSHAILAKDCWNIVKLANRK